MMSVHFLTNISEKEFKDFLKDALNELLAPRLGSKSEQLPEILDIQQASELLKLKINTLYEKTSRKLLPHFKKGNKLYFYRSELEQWISDGKVKTIEDIKVEAQSFTMLRKVA